MKFFDIVQRAGRSLQQAKARTILTSLAIGVGAFTITLSLAAGAGGRQYAQNLVSANTDVRELRVQQKQAQGFDQSKPQEYREGVSTESVGPGFRVSQLTQADLGKIAQVDGVESVDPMYSLEAKYVAGPNHKKYQVSVTTYNQSIKQDYVAGSPAPSRVDSVVIPEAYRAVLGYVSDQEAIGKTINLVVNKKAAPAEDKTFSLTITAVYKSSPLTFTNSMAVQVSPAMAKSIYDYSMQGAPGYGNYFVAIVHAKADTPVETVKTRLTDQGYSVQTAQDVMSTLFNFINVLQGILIGFGALAVLTSIFGIINTQYISVLERTQQIGLMKALGMRRRDVGRLFKLEAAWIGFLGGALGSLLAFVAGVMANPSISKVLSLEAGTNLLIFMPWMFVVVIGGLMLVAVVSGILPARKAAKLDPIEALRTE